MLVKIFEDQTQIAAAEVYAPDPPMGVAVARLTPTEAYDSKRHANVIDGEFFGDRGDILQIETDDGTAIVCRVISIQDYPTLNERYVEMIGITEPSLEKLFADHPDFMSYWGR